ncbi:MAG: peptide deformylase [Defluviitaleaceae bacterium]|nr:peptide deformylase [Defluviitaleaceae bacterium]
MALREIRIEGDEILEKISKPVVEVNDGIRQLADDMLETMYNAGGVGIAAVQVGVLRRMFVLDASEDNNEPMVLINPEIISSGGLHSDQEACLSVPGLAGDVDRPKTAVVKFLDRDGNPQQMRFDERMSVIVHHEMDHLNGILYTERAKDVYEVE